MANHIMSIAITYTGWWFQPTPLKNHGVRQLGLFHSQLNGKSHKIPWFQSPPTKYFWMGCPLGCWDDKNDS
jgi:hypothetical protein